MKTDSVLILTMTGDSHTRSVEWLLNKRGIPTYLWFNSDFPKCATGSVHIEKNELNVLLNSSEGSFKSDGDVIFWYRRSTEPNFSEGLHPSDLPVAIRETAGFFESLYSSIDHLARFSVNPMSGMIQARSKSLQLKFAVESGLRIPTTLISNSPDEIEQFYLRNDKSIIIKSFSSPSWASSSRSYYAYTTKVSGDVIRNRSSLSASPEIYQALIQKKYEVRAFFMGRTYVAVNLESQNLSRSMTDWRAAGTANLQARSVKLPDHVVNGCLEFMNKIGIVTGSFDFAVTPDDEYVFFEVNEQGQFLWIEECCPELPVLQMFCDFLVSKNPDFVWNDRRNENETFAEFKASGRWEEKIQIEATNHVMVERRPYTEKEELKIPA